MWSAMFGLHRELLNEGKIMSKFEQGMYQGAANYQALTPLSLLERARDVYADQIAVIDGERRFTWKQYTERCFQLARALIHAGVKKEDTVSFFVTNRPAMLEAQFGVPLSGGVINTLNIRLDVNTIAYILQHSESKIIVVEDQFIELIREAVKLSEREIQIIQVLDDAAKADLRAEEIDYETFIAQAPEQIEVHFPENEMNAIALSYTSGTTGKPKGVIYHHRGAYLNALGTVIYAGFNQVARPVYLWTLPVFHCNGWCHVWALAAVGGTHVCLRKVVAEDIYTLIQEHGVTHFSGAPAVLATLAENKPEHWQQPDREITVCCAGAPPPFSVLKQTEKLGFKVLHVYGMTEQHSVNTVCEPQPDWKTLSEDERLHKMCRQGVITTVGGRLKVADHQTGEPVPKDGMTMGEIMFQGNLGMKGYLKNPEATAEAFASDWYHSGDLAVWHADGYIEIKDRLKDIIISGGENISSIEVEEALLTHPAVHEVAVVAVPDEKWGEVPCAIVQLHPEYVQTTREELFAHSKKILAGYKTPKHIFFEDVERTSTGKLQKFKLRQHVIELLSGN